MVVQIKKRTKKRGMKVIKKKRIIKRGKGIINKLIDKLPFELHIPTYHYCGPGTKLAKRLTQNDPGINELDRACKQHDIAYAQSSSVTDRNKADKILAESAWKRVKSSNASIGERAAALGVTGAMRIKSKLGMGLPRDGGKRDKLLIYKKKSTLTKKKKKKVKAKAKNIKQIYRNATRSAKAAILTEEPQTIPEAAKLAITAARAAVKGHKPSKQSIHDGLPRIIPVPKIGGVLPLIPIFAGLSALGALMGGSASVTNAVLSAQNAKRKLKEAARHNETMEAVALSNGSPKRRRQQSASTATATSSSSPSTGFGLHLKPYKSGLGLYLSPKSDSKNM